MINFLKKLNIRKRKLYNKNYKDYYQHSINILDTLLRHLSEINKSFKHGREMLKTVHAYWETDSDCFERFKYYDIKGKPIKYDVLKYKKNRNKFLKSKIKKHYRPRFSDLKELALKINHYKSKLKYYQIHGEPSFYFDYKTLELKITGFKTLHYPFPSFLEDKEFKKLKWKKDSTPQQESERLNRIEEHYLLLYRNKFAEYEQIEKEDLNFNIYLNDIFADFVRLINDFQNHYKLCYEIIYMSYNEHIKKTSKYNSRIELWDTINSLRLPKSPCEYFCQPPYINLPNIVSLEENLNLKFV